MRYAQIVRKTAETDIRLALNADGTGKSTAESEAENAGSVEILPFVLVRSADGYLSAEKYLGFLSGDGSKYAAFTFAGKGFLMMLLLAVLGGSAGAICGMYAFRHKTRHWYFRYGLPAILLAQLALTAGWAQ